MACKDCFYCKLILPINKKKFFSTSLWGNLHTKVKCVKGWWLNYKVEEVEHTLRSVLRNSEKVRKAYKTCPYKNENEEEKNI